MSVRIYVPATLRTLARISEHGGIGPSPVHAHAVTQWLRAEWPEADEEELAYAALMAAADDAAAALAAAGEDEEERPRRVVLVAEVPGVVEDPESTAVTADSAISLRVVAAVHADTEDIDPTAGDELGDLGWFGVQEIPELIE